MTLKLNRVRAVVKVHVNAKFHQAECSGYHINREKTDENNTVGRYRGQ